MSVSYVRSAEAQPHQRENPGVSTSLACWVSSGGRCWRGQEAQLGVQRQYGEVEVRRRRRG
jgi:hypothetical protein